MLGAPPAFVLSQDQTLSKKSLTTVFLEISVKSQSTLFLTNGYSVFKVHFPHNLNSRFSCLDSIMRAALDPVVWGRILILPEAPEGVNQFRFRFTGRLIQHLALHQTQARENLL